MNVHKVLKLSCPQVISILAFLIPVMWLFLSLKTDTGGIDSIAGKEKTVPGITGLTYDNINQSGVTVYWVTDVPADSRIWWMVSDSNDQPVSYTDSMYISSAVTSHTMMICNLCPATIYKYRISSHNPDGYGVDSGYFITQSASSGMPQVYFNHTVNTSVATGEHALGNQNFDNLLKSMISNANYSIDIALFEFNYYSDIADALIAAKDRGVKIRFIYNHTANTPQTDSMAAHGIPIIKRNTDTLHSMHNKFWILDYRYNSDPSVKWFAGGSTNVTHPQFHSDRNNIITIQDEALCAVYTREFEEMWGSHGDFPDITRSKFGTSKKDNVPHILNIGGMRTEIYFTPSDSVARHLTRLISAQTSRSIFFSMLKFCLPLYEDTLHMIFNKGMEVKGVFDSANAWLPGSAYPRMKGLAVPNAWSPTADVYTNPINGLVHHKYMIIDANTKFGNKITATGSFNWETPADSANDENWMVFYDERINNLYFQEFYMRYTESGGEPINIQGIDTVDGGREVLFQLYPNPCTNMVHVGYCLASPCNVKINVFDARGAKVACFADGFRNAGNHNLDWKTDVLGPGLYYFQIETPKYCHSGKLIKVRD